jgi:hypothetical protein
MNFSPTATWLLLRLEAPESDTTDHSGDVPGFWVGVHATFM